MTLMLKNNPTVVGNNPEFTKGNWATMSMIGASLRYMKNRSPNRYKECIKLEQQLFDKYLNKFKEKS